MKSSDSQWLFPIEALKYTPSQCPLDRELVDRARGVEFAFRLGLSLQMPMSALCTAATWLHRFYMRYTLEDFWPEEVATACIFVATKTEECGRKLRDVARIYLSKMAEIDLKEFADDNKDLAQAQSMILRVEEYVLEALCFDLFVESPHSELVDIFDIAHKDEEDHTLLEEYAWTFAHDSYRTPLCILYPPQIVAAACYVLAQHLFDGPNSSSLDARLSAVPPSASLPTPPTHKPPSPDASRFVVEHYAFSPVELHSVAEALNILLEFYRCQNPEKLRHLGAITSISPPTSVSNHLPLYTPWPDLETSIGAGGQIEGRGGDFGRTPSTDGGRTPNTEDWSGRR
ncbi:cyclin-like protein [Fistulina hepatica ATCC 64428]|nr:cyclin-like protein [Fistulina hepatica ATCC 64428]